MNSTIRTRVVTSVNRNHRLFREETVGRKCCYEVHGEIYNRPVSGMFYLSHILEFIIDGFYKRSLSKEEFVTYGHDSTFHVALEFGDKLDSVHEKLVEEPFADVSFVSHQFARNVFDKRFVLEGFPVINISRRKHETEQFALLVTNKVEFEAVELAHRALPALCKAFKHLVHVDSLVLAYPQGRTINKTNSRARSHQTLLQKENERHNNLSFQFREPVVRHSIREKVCHMLLNVVGIKMLQALVVGKMKQNHYRYDLCIGHLRISVILPIFLVSLGCKAINLYKSVVNNTKVIYHAENFSNFVFGDHRSDCLRNWFVVIPNLQKLSLFS